MGAEVEVREIWKSYEKPVLKGVSLKAPKGKITVILGPSGVGKTTLLRIIAGLEKQDSGHVIFDGEIVDDKEPKERKVSMVFQSPSLMPHLDVKENICFGLGKLDEEVAKKYAKMLKIEDLLDKLPEEISGGEQQRVAIARALAVNPEVILLDEPFSHLDAQLKEELLQEIPKILKELGITGIYVTHDRGEALNVAEHLAVMIRGKILEEGDPLEVYFRPRTLEGAVFLGHNLIETSEGRYTFPPEAVKLEGDLQAKVLECRREKYYWVVRAKVRGGVIVFPSPVPLSGEVGIEIDPKMIIKRRGDPKAYPLFPLRYYEG